MTAASKKLEVAHIVTIGSNGNSGQFSILNNDDKVAIFANGDSATFTIGSSFEDGNFAVQNTSGEKAISVNAATKETEIEGTLTLKNATDTIDVLTELKALREEIEALKQQINNP